MITMFPPLFNPQELIKSYCLDTGHVCPHWVNKSVLEDLEFLDEKDDGKRAKEYYDMCHSVECILRPASADREPECIIRCRPNAIDSLDKCDYSNPEAAAKILEEIMTMQGTNGSADSNSNV